MPITTNRPRAPRPRREPGGGGTRRRTVRFGAGGRRWDGALRGSQPGGRWRSHQTPGAGDRPVGGQTSRPGCVRAGATVYTSGEHCPMRGRARLGGSGTNRLRGPPSEQLTAWLGRCAGRAGEAATGQRDRAGGRRRWARRRADRSGACAPPATSVRLRAVSISERAEFGTTEGEPLVRGGVPTTETGFLAAATDVADSIDGVVVQHQPVAGRGHVADASAAQPDGGFRCPTAPRC